MHEWIFPLIGGVMLVVGLGLFSGAIVLLLRKIWRMSKSARATGVVMNVEVSEGMRQPIGSTRNTLFKPTVRFRTADGRVVDYTPNTSNSWSNYSVGENVPVYYDPQRPEKVVVGTTYKLWFPFFLFGFVGGLFTLIGAFFVFVIGSFP